MLPHRPTNPNALPPAEMGLSFLAGVIAEADKLIRVAHLRGDPVLPEILQVRRVPSQSTLSRFFAGSVKLATRLVLASFITGRWSS